MILALSILVAGAVRNEAPPTVIRCHFEHMPPMVMILRDGMGGSRNTLQIGKRRPIPLSVGSSLMSASYGAQDLTFSLRLPSSVSVGAVGADTATYYGDCSQPR